ncbi:MAG: mitochondrial fission ELM1 family protein, partial [Candidatus Omnitrophica bacterium]|nr:mitochondrial fission ELM1 family protein [Candidatus Omnitrophota bacterium]
MNIDYLGCIIVKTFAFFIRRLPLSWSLGIGRFLGRIGYCFYGRRVKVSLANLRMALSHQKSPEQLRQINRGLFENLGMNLMEVLYFPKFDKEFMEKYVQVEGKEYVDQALEQGKGLIYIGAHFGNWELSALKISMFGYPLHVLAREQRHSQLNDLLNSYRQIKGAGVVPKGMAVRQIMRSLKNNQTIGMLADQDSGRRGLLIRFFGRLASTASGPIDIALRTGAAVIPTFFAREEDNSHRLIFYPPLKIKNTGNKEDDIRSELEEYISIVESIVNKYPQQYLWAHKRWKSSSQRRIVILTDGKAGHLRQAWGVGELFKEVIAKHIRDQWKDYSQNIAGVPKGTAHQTVPYKTRQNAAFGGIVDCQIINIEFKKNKSKLKLGWLTRVFGRRPGFNLHVLKSYLTKKSYDQIAGVYGDFIVSCGSGAEAVAYLLGKENNARTVHILKPAYIPIKRFDLGLIPWHDRPQAGKNTLTTLIAPSPITQQHISQQAEQLTQHINEEEGVKELDENGSIISVFIGGDTDGYQLRADLILKLSQHLKTICCKSNTRVLITTSRRTSPKAEEVLIEQFGSDPVCKLLIIANRANIEGAVDGMLGLADTV